MIVQSDFPDGRYLRMTRQRAQPLKCVFGRLRRIVRMDAHGGVQERVPLRQANRGFQIGRTVAGPNRHQPFNPRRAGALDGLFAVFVELLVVQMAMGIDQLHFSRAPTGMSSRNPASTGLPPSTEAATIIPFDVSPRSLRGCRLATITTLRLIICSGL